MVLEYLNIQLNNRILYLDNLTIYDKLVKNHFRITSFSVLDLDVVVNLTLQPVILCTPTEQKVVGKIKSEEGFSFSFKLIGNLFWMQW